jgi:nucleoside-diphosphate-sugar epimerase
VKVGRPRIAVLGATGHVGQVLAHRLAPEAADLVLVARDPVRARAVAQAAGREGSEVVTFDDLPDIRVDAIVNCVGIGDPAALSSAGAAVYELTQHFDDACLGYLAAHPETACVNMSSGAVYGTGFEKPADDETVLEIAVNAIAADQHYSIAKAASEARHRALPGARIIDLRIFGLYSRYLDPGARYLANDLVRCVVERTVFRTDAADLARDFVHPDDLAALVLRCVSGDVGNAALDVTSRQPVTKSALLDAFAERFGLAWEVVEGSSPVGATGRKPRYYSVSRQARDIGWEPRYSALESVLAEAGHVIASHRGANG